MFNHLTFWPLLITKAPPFYIVIHSIWISLCSSQLSNLSSVNFELNKANFDTWVTSMQTQGFPYYIFLLQDIAFGPDETNHTEYRVVLYKRSLHIDRHPRGTTELRWTTEIFLSHFHPFPHVWEEGGGYIQSKLRSGLSGRPERMFI